MSPAPLHCGADTRRARLFGNADWNGIDHVDVGEDQVSLCIHFFNGIPAGIGPENIRITGGRRITGLRAIKVSYDQSRDSDLDDCLRVVVDRPGDLATYRLCLIAAGGGPMPGIDPRYACVEFGFRTDCAADLDCGAAPQCEPEPEPPVVIDYLAKDYASFRQLIYDRLALIMPDWRERHAPDLGVTVVEILAYVGDHLSYYQDAVATEAYLETARQRTSARRHLRLIDYHLHEGCNARAFVTVDTSDDFELRAGQFYFIANLEGGAAQPAILDREAVERLPLGAYEVFEPVAPSPDTVFAFRAAHGSIAFHDWGDSECCLPKGATEATLVDHEVEDEAADEGEAPGRLHLEVGDFLIFEEILGPVTGSLADADPARRHVVRLTSVVPGYDALLRVAVVEIGWAEEDALPFSLCLSARRAAPDCDLISGISVARGNVVLVDHGRSRTEPLPPAESRDAWEECACEGSIVERRTLPLPYAPRLPHAPLTFAQPTDPQLSASRLIRQDVREALPWVRLAEPLERGPAAEWRVRRDLLSSQSDDRHFVAEMDDEGRAQLRFGDGEHGRHPPAGESLIATYRTGNGPAGNVEGGAIAAMALRDTDVDVASLTVRNPIRAQGGTAREPVAEARRLGPAMIFARRERAIIAEDYAELARRSPRLQGATASLRWNGSWYEAVVATDALDAAAADSDLGSEVSGMLHRYRRIGHDLRVVAARTVPLKLKIEICVAPNHVRGQVHAALLDEFGTRSLAGGRLGFFHRDRQRFGDNLHISQILAAALAVDGVEIARVTELRRLNRGDEGALEAGRLVMRANEIPRLDNDPNFPENGQLELILKGGR